MRLTTILLLAACLQIHAKGLTQTLTLKFSNAPLEKVFSEIQRQTGYSFFYEDGLLKDARPVDIAVVKASITMVLDLCFNNQPYTYKIVNTAISIRRKEQHAVIDSRPPTPETGDPVTVSGKVTDPEGNPLTGANVKVKGTSVGVTTDNLGRFTLVNIDANAVLEVTYVGHDSQIISVKGKTNLMIALMQRQSILDETVVIAYGTSSRRFTTGNIASVKAADIEKQPVQNPLLALQGRVPGIEITQLSGINGGGVTVRIQGRNTIRNGQEPLVVIDGVPYPTQLTNTNLEDIVQRGSPLNYIDPSEIESIDVLKDADATSIYGSRAANGAILITTKKGKAGRIKFNANVQQGIGKVTRKVRMMNTEQYLEMRNEGFFNDGIKPSSDPNAINQLLYAPDLTLWDTTRYTDWQKVLIGGTAKYTNVSAGISGGSTTMQYRVGTSVNRQTTVFPGNSEGKSGSIQFNLNGASSSQKFKIQLTGNYQISDNGLPGADLTGQAILLEPNAPALYNEDGTLNWEPSPTGASTWSNPLRLSSYNDFNNTTRNLVSNSILSYAVLPGLEIRSSFGYTNIQSQLFASTGLNNYPPELRVIYSSAGRMVKYSTRNMENWLIEPQFLYKKKIDKYKFDCLLGCSIQQNTENVLSLTASGFNSDMAMRNIASAVTTRVIPGTSIMYKYNALFGRFNTNYADKLILNLTARRDGSSRFGEKSKFHNFWSAGLAWIFTEEKWLKQVLPFLSFGKVRGSYGITGNDQISDYSYLSLYNYVTTPIAYQNTAVLRVDRITNPYYHWEETHKLQGGIDLGLLKDRILLSFTYARNRSSNQLVAYQLPTITGFTSIFQNFPASIQNTSLEITLNTTNIKIKDFTWITSINLTIPRNKLISFPNIENTTYASGNNNVIVGQPLGVIKTFHFGGVDPLTGNYYVIDKDGNATTNPNTSTDNNVLINPIAKYYGGIQNGFTYRGFSLDFLIQVVQKIGANDLNYNNGGWSPGYFSAGESNQPVTVMNRWQKTLDSKPIARYTAAGTIDSWANVSDAALTMDASYIRLKNVSLSWFLPSVWLQKIHIQSGNLYFRGQNLATKTRYRGLDPETQSVRVLPPMQVWTAGFQVEL